MANGKNTLVLPALLSANAGYVDTTGFLACRDCLRRM